MPFHSRWGGGRKQLIQDVVANLDGQVDSARAYRNEAQCANALRASGLQRSDIFYTTKVPVRAMGYQKTRDSIESSLHDAKLDFIDLYVFY